MKKGIRGLFLGPASVSKWDHPLASGTQLTIRVMERRRRTNERETVAYHNLVDHHHNNSTLHNNSRDILLIPIFAKQTSKGIRRFLRICTGNHMSAKLANFREWWARQNYFLQKLFFPK
jgi:hypothetical protein